MVCRIGGAKSKETRYSIYVKVHIPEFANEEAY